MLNSYTFIHDIKRIEVTEPMPLLNSIQERKIKIHVENGGVIEFCLFANEAKNLVFIASEE